MNPTIPTRPGARGLTTHSWHIRQVGRMSTLAFQMRTPAMKGYSRAIQIERNP